MHINGFWKFRHDRLPGLEIEVVRSREEATHYLEMRYVRPESNPHMVTTGENKPLGSELVEGGATAVVLLKIEGADLDSTPVEQRTEILLPFLNMVVEKAKYHWPCICRRYSIDGTELDITEF